MLLVILISVACIAFILISCFLFTNAIELFGKELNFNQGVVGSVFAAIGTALPETIIPIIAILFSTGESRRKCIEHSRILSTPYAQTYCDNGSQATMVIQLRLNIHRKVTRGG